MNYHFEEGTPEDLQEATKKAFYPVNGSGVLDLGHKYNWIRNGRDHWGFDFRKIGEAHNIDEALYWDIHLVTRGAIMMNADGCSYWAIRVERQVLCCFEREEFGKCKCIFGREK